MDTLVLMDWVLIQNSNMLPEKFQRIHWSGDSETPVNMQDVAAKHFRCLQITPSAGLLPQSDFSQFPQNQQLAWFEILTNRHFRYNEMTISFYILE